MVYSHYYGYMDILGFHPHKKIALLHVSLTRVLAYHLKDTKVQDLSYIHLTIYNHFIKKLFIMML
jgi:hypothetical protein